MQNLLIEKNIMQRLIIHARKLLLPLDIFKNIDVFVEKDVLSNHKFKLIDIILRKYFTVRLHHESQTFTDKIQRIRTYHNRLVVFKNQ